MESLLLLAIHTSIFLLVFTLGLALRLDEHWYLLRRPGLLIRSLFAMNLVMPVFATVLSLSFNLHPAVKIALVALAVSPVPPLLPMKQLKAGGHPTYVFGLLVSAVLFSIVFVPVAMLVLSGVFAIPLRMPAGQLAMMVVFKVLFPLAAGVFVRSVFPRFAGRTARPLSILAAVLLGLGVLPVVFKSWPLVLSLIGNGALAALVVFCVTGLAIGHWLGGPDAGNRTVLALATASRHPGIAIAIATANFPEEKSVLGVMLLYLAVSPIVFFPYVSWRRHVRGDERRAA